MSLNLQLWELGNFSLGRHGGGKPVRVTTTVLEGS